MQAYGSIPDDYHVHHIDWNPKNDDAENLIAVSEEIHVAIHRCDRDLLASRESIMVLVKMFDEIETLRDAPREKQLRWLLRWLKKNMKIAKALGLKKQKKFNPWEQMDWLPYVKQFK